MTDSIVGAHCRIAGQVESSVLFDGVRVDRGAVVRQCVLHHRNYVGTSARLTRVVADGRSSETALLPNVGDRASVGGDGKGKTNADFPRQLGTGVTFLGRDVEIPARTADEPCWLVIGKIADRHWSVVVTYREQRIRIISARRVRKEEQALYEG